MWGKMVNHFLIKGKHITDITRDRVCLIYSLIHDDININVGAFIFSIMKKARYHEGCRYGFGGLLTKFLRKDRVEEEDLDYKVVVFMRSINVMRVRSLAMAHGSILTMFEH